MDGHFHIDVDVSRQLLRVVMGGFFTPELVADYHRAVHDATAKLAAPIHRQAMLCDISAMKIQSQEVVAAFGQVMSDPAYQTRPVAFVVSSTLARMQAQRVIGNRTARLFGSEAEALDWLFARAASAA